MINNTTKNILVAIILLNNVVAYAQNRPAPSGEAVKKTIYYNATIHIGDGKVIKNGAIGFDAQGKIDFVGDGNTAFASDVRAINVSGKHIYPGFIASNTLLGLRDIDAVRATNDYMEVGAYNPNARALVAYNTDSRITPTVRSRGVLLAQSTPVGGVISGKSSVFALDGWNWDDAVLRADDGVHLNWPNLYQSSGWWAEPGPTSRNKTYDENVAAIKQFFSAAKAYCAQAKPTRNARYAAMREVLETKQTLYVHVSDAKAMLDIINMNKDYGCRLVFVGAEDAWRIADVLFENNISVILPETNRLPERADDDIDLPYKIPVLLAQKGITFTFSIDGGWEQRDFIFQAGQAIGFGLPYERAVQACTLDAAKILGIEAQVGSLVVGKDATLIVTEGDIFEPRTSGVSAAYIKGKTVDLNNHQVELYKRYEKRYAK